MNNKQLLKEYGRKNEIIRQRLRDFKQLGHEDLFYELCFCLLTPQSKAKSCDSVVKELKSRRFLERPFRPNRLLKQKTRFHNNKSRYLLEARKRCDCILLQLDKRRDPKEIREWLVANVKGLGYKEASHFLRNIGFEGVAILDRHILRNLESLGVINMPRTLTRKRYLEIEKSFERFAKSTGIPMDELDLLFWSMQTGEVFK
ncbi:N-glycosylase/DNA lyase [Candidatus Woesearchaeota archaeon]|nr:N-glycosylase/DNA lyase [Candidatus Woesearchaeota archaeon]